MYGLYDPQTWIDLIEWIDWDIVYLKIINECTHSIIIGYTHLSVLTISHEMK